MAVDFRGEIYAISKYVGVRTKEVKAKTGPAENLPSIESTKSAISARMSGILRGHIQEAETRFKTHSASLAFRRNETVQRQREEREHFEKAQQERWAQETRERTQRLSKGFRGLWDRLTGKHVQIRRQNELETVRSMQRDRAEKSALIFR